MRCPVYTLLASNMSQMSLPDELVHAILIRTQDHDATWKPIKRGLTSCSLTCRHWAKLIRPMLFYSLVLRSTDDIEQLLAFLSTPDSLGNPLRSCLGSVEAVEEQTASAAPWSHHVFRLYGAVGAHMTWTIRCRSADQQPDQTQSALLPSSILPRTFPISTTYPSRLVLSGLRLPSVQHLVNFVQHVRVREIEIVDIIFTDGDLDRVRWPRRPHPWGKHRFLDISFAFAQPSNLQTSLKLSGILFASQGRMQLNDRMLTLVEKHVLLLVTHTQRQDDVRKLVVRFIMHRDLSSACLWLSVSRRLKDLLVPAQVTAICTMSMTKSLVSCPHSPWTQRTLDLRTRTSTGWSPSALP